MPSKDFKDHGVSDKNFALDVCTLWSESKTDPLHVPFVSVRIATKSSRSGLNNAEHSMILSADVAMDFGRRLIEASKEAEGHYHAKPELPATPLHGLPESDDALST